MQDYRNLKVWQKSHELVLSIYKLTSKFPKDELYALTSQIRRAAVSIPANIAEGCARGGDGEFGHFLSIAQGSAGELDYHLLLAHDLHFMDDAAHRSVSAILTEVRRMLTSFIQTLRPSRGVLKAKS